MADLQIIPSIFTIERQVYFAPTVAAQQTMWADSGATLSVVEIDCARAWIRYAAICLKTLPRVSDWCLSFERPSPELSSRGRLAALDFGIIRCEWHMLAATRRGWIAAKQLAGLITFLAFDRANLACKL